MCYRADDNSFYKSHLCRQIRQDKSFAHSSLDINRRAFFLFKKHKLFYGSFKCSLYGLGCCKYGSPADSHSKRFISERYRSKDEYDACLLALGNLFRSDRLRLSSFDRNKLEIHLHRPIYFCSIDLFFLSFIKKNKTSSFGRKQGCL